MARRGRSSSAWFSTSSTHKEAAAETVSMPAFPAINIPPIPPTYVRPFDLIESDVTFNPEASGTLLEDLSKIQLSRPASPLSHESNGLFPAAPKFDIPSALFPLPEPVRPNLQPPPNLRPKPRLADFKKPLTFFDKLFSYRAGLKFIKWEAEHQAALEIWEGDNTEYQERKSVYDAAMNAFEKNIVNGNRPRMRGQRRMPTRSPEYPKCRQPGRRPNGLISRILRAIVFALKNLNKP